MLRILSHDAYALIDTGAMHSCMSKDFVHACGLILEKMTDFVMSVSTPLGPSSLQTKILKSVEVLVNEVSMPINMLILPMIDFDVILGMDWLTKY